MKRLSFVLALLIFNSAWALEQVMAAPPASVDPARAQAAEAFAASIDLRSQLKAANEIAAGQLEATVLRQVIESEPKMRDAIKANPQRYERVMSALQSKLADEVRRLNSEMEPEVYIETIAIYARTFTVAELDDITKFYASTLGQKLLAKQPQLMRECIEMSQRLMVAKLPTLMNRLIAALPKESFDAETPAASAAPNSKTDL